MSEIERLREALKWAEASCEAWRKDYEELQASKVTSCRRAAAEEMRERIARYFEERGEPCAAAEVRALPTEVLALPTEE